MRSDSYILVIGGTNMDIGARPFGALLPHDSLPGAVTKTPGGVGRNIAVSLAQLGHRVIMLTAVGNDADGRELLQLGEAAGINLSHVRVLDDAPTSLYIYVSNGKGEIQWAVCDASASDRIDRQYLAENADLIRGASAVVLDTNPPESAIVYAAETASEAGVPLFVDPISAAKATKVRGIMPYITAIKPNKGEAQVLYGRPLLTIANAEEAVISMLGDGVKEVYLTLGKDGVLAAENSQNILRLPGFARHLVNTSGCGDAYLAAVVHAHLLGQDLRGKARAGVAASSISMETKSAVNPALTAAAIEERLKLF